MGAGKRNARWVALFVIAALIAGACGGSSDSASPPEPTDMTEGDTGAVVTVPTSVPTTEPPTLVAAAELLPGLGHIASPYLGHELPSSLRPDSQCPGWDQFDGLEPTDEAFRSFRGVQGWAPTVQLGIYDFPAGQADALIDAYLAGAAGPCASYATTTETGGPLNLEWSEGPTQPWGDRSVLLEVRGETFGFAVDSDVVLIRVGNRLGYVGYLELGFEPDPELRDAAAAALTAALSGETVPTVEDLPNSTPKIEAVLPGMDELANPELRFEGRPAIPNVQCPGNPVTLAGLRPTGSAVQRFFDDADFGPHVTVAIMELPEGQADEFIDRWVQGAEGACSQFTASNLEFDMSVGSSPEYADRTVTLQATGRHGSLGVPAGADHIFIRHGDFVGYLYYLVIDLPAPDAARRDQMAAALAEALAAL